MRIPIILRKSGTEKGAAREKGSAAGAHGVLAGDGWGEWVQLSSSNLSATRYNAEDSLLQIAFSSGGTYTYQHVPPGVFEGLTLATSPGRYFLTAIKPPFTSSKE